MLIHWSMSSGRHLLCFFWSMLFILVTERCLSQSFFANVTDSADINHQFKVLEGMFGGGACAFDFNKDGFDDLYITGGTNDDQLYRNNGDGTFTNVFEGSGLEVSKHFVTQGVASADVNRDGWNDLFITTISSRDSAKIIHQEINLLFLNQGDGSFKDMTEAYGLDRYPGFSTSASFGDFNLDGWPDLYVGNYFHGYDGPLYEITDATIVNATKTAKGFLLLNEGGKSFKDVYEDYGLDQRGFGFGGLFTDIDFDGDPDLLVHHDFGYKATPNLLLLNQYPKKEFTDVAKPYGLDLKINSMGTAIGDINDDGYWDYFITNIRFNRFMVSQDTLVYKDQLKEYGLHFHTISWGANFADFDHDFDLDLYVTNSDLNPNTVPMANFYFKNDAGHFTDAAREYGLNDYGLGRGTVAFDMENDGDLDILVINQAPVMDYPVESNTTLYRNDLQTGNWLKVKLQGITSESEGIGARLVAITGSKKLTREIYAGSSHMSQNPLYAHFGLNTLSQLDTLKIFWPGHKTPQVVANIKVNQMIEVVEPIRERRAQYNRYWYYVFMIGVVLAGMFFVMRRRSNKS